VAIERVGAADLRASGYTTNSYPSINPNSANASGSFTPANTIVATAGHGGHWTDDTVLKSLRDLHKESFVGDRLASLWAGRSVYALHCEAILIVHWTPIAPPSVNFRAHPNALNSTSNPAITRSIFATLLWKCCSERVRILDS